MTYVEGFVLAVPTANKDAYRKHAAGAAPLFRDFGVARMVETWGDDVPDGKVNDFKSAVQAKPDEAVVFSWFEYPDRATRDAATTKMMSDPRMAAMGAAGMWRIGLMPSSIWRMRSGRMSKPSTGKPISEMRMASGIPT